MTQNKRLGPTFVVIGAAKGGTNTIYHVCKSSPDVFFTDPREPQFFDKNFDRGVDWYYDLFSAAYEWQARGEKTVSYSIPHNARRVAERMREFFPELKIIFSVRQPHDRIISHWRMLRRYDANVPDLNDALADNRYWGILVNRCRYWRVTEEFLRCFGDDRVKVLLMDDLESDQEIWFQDLLRFIDADTPPAINVEKKQIKNASDKNKVTVPKPAFSPEVRDRVATYLHDDVNALFRYLGRNPELWGF